MIRITANPRLHLTLIGMNHNGYRGNGGVGFAVDKPTIIISGEISDSFSVLDKRDKPINESQKKRLEATINKTISSLQLKKNIGIVIEGEMPTNFGFGSGTVIRLASLELLLIVNNVTYSKDQLIELSGRGGTSGIGIRTYFHGGFVFDIGHKNLNMLLPSNQVEYSNYKKSLLLDQSSMPDWTFLICTPKLLTPLSEEEEKNFFCRQYQSMTMKFTKHFIIAYMDS